MSYTVTITKTVEIEKLESIYMSESEAEEAGFDKSGYVKRLVKQNIDKEIYSQTVEDGELNINSVIKAVMGEGK